jgi:hypothetical protein
MKANVEVLILEDDVEELAGLRRHFEGKSFHPLGARSAAHAIRVLKNTLETNRPAVAIVDWDLSKAPDQTRSSTDFLCVLARHVPECLPIVYSANVDSFRVRSDIHRAHPRAWLHDKRDGEQSLLARVDRMLDKTVEDLCVRGGAVVVHLPTRDEHHHREAVRLMVHHPEVVTFHSDTATKAARRFGSWLATHESRVRLVSHGNRRYGLTVAR